MPKAPPLRFGVFEFEPRSYELRRAGRPLRLEPTPLEILLLLIERRGELVTREEIVARIWGDGIYVDTDNSIIRDFVTEAIRADERSAKGRAGAGLPSTQPKP